MRLTSNKYTLNVNGQEPVVSGHFRLYGEAGEYAGVPDDSGTWYDDGDGAYVLRRTSEKEYQEVCGHERQTFLVA